jgi:hypothetical protein
MDQHRAIFKEPTCQQIISNLLCYWGNIHHGEYSCVECGRLVFNPDNKKMVCRRCNGKQAGRIKHDQAVFRIPDKDKLFFNVKALGRKGAAVKYGVSEATIHRWKVYHTHEKRHA